MNVSDVLEPERDRPLIGRHRVEAREAEAETEDGGYVVAVREFEDDGPDDAVDAWAQAARREDRSARP
jgi:hypothetical protein